MAVPKVKGATAWREGHGERKMEGRGQSPANTQPLPSQIPEPHRRQIFVETKERG